MQLFKKIEEEIGLKEKVSSLPPAITFSADTFSRDASLTLFEQELIAKSFRYPIMILPLKRIGDSIDRANGLQRMRQLCTSLTPRTMALMVALRGPSTVFPSSVGPQEAL